MSCEFLVFDCKVPRHCGPPPYMMVRFFRGFYHLGDYEGENPLFCLGGKKIPYFDIGETKIPCFDLGENKNPLFFLGENKNPLLFFRGK